jgi:hypothetical protein
MCVARKYDWLMSKGITSDFQEPGKDRDSTLKPKYKLINNNQLIFN